MVFVDLVIRGIRYPEVSVCIGYSVRVCIPASCNVKVRAGVGPVCIVFVYPGRSKKVVCYPEISVCVGYSVRICIPASGSVKTVFCIGSV